VLKEGRIHTLVTNVFSHYDPLHLAANMGRYFFFGKKPSVLKNQVQYKASTTFLLEVVLHLVLVEVLLQLLEVVLHAATT